MSISVTCQHATDDANHEGACHWHSQCWFVHNRSPHVWMCIIPPSVGCEHGSEILVALGTDHMLPPPLRIITYSFSTCMIGSDQQPGLLTRLLVATTGEFLPRHNGTVCRRQWLLLQKVDLLVSLVPWLSDYAFWSARDYLIVMFICSKNDPVFVGNTHVFDIWK